jgi:hypothetical protein
MKRSLFGLSQAKREGHHVLSRRFDWLYLPHVLLLKWVVVKYSGVPLPGSFEISVQIPHPHPGRSVDAISNYRRQHRRTTLREKAAVPVCSASMEPTH